MSRRTAEANKAILAAWDKEQELVQEGKGTREWTLKQQQDIIDKGKAYDEDGVAFQGQHMKSAEKYPEYQGDPRNIQFLTRAEHLEAHDGNWRNPTNWYFNPITKEKTDFGDGKFIPCKIIQLTESIVKPQIAQVAENEVVQESVKELQKKAIQSTTQEKSQKAASLMNSNVEPKPELGFGQKLKNAFKTRGEKILEFQVNHPVATKIIKGVGVAAAYFFTESITRSGSSKSGNGQSDDNQTNDDTSFDDDEYSYEEGILDTVQRSSPIEHMVKGHGQHYHTKDGLIWKKKEPFTRGGKKDE